VSEARFIKRTLLSLAAGASIIFLPAIAGPMLFPDRTPGSDNLALNTIVTFLYWPTHFVRKPWSSLDCPNADLIAEKLNCIAISLGVDVFVFSALCFAYRGWQGRDGFQRDESDIQRPSVARAYANARPYTISILAQTRHCPATSLL